MLRTIHRFSAFLLILFLVAHVGNHLIALSGVAAHMAAMDALRLIYRHSAVEIILLAAFGIQIITGLTRVIGGWRTRSGSVAWLQAVSGLYLAIFLLIHVGAVLAARSNGVDTNFYFAAAGLHVDGFIWFFLPYYSLAVASLFTHLGCAIYWSRLAQGEASARRVLQTFMAIGLTLAMMIVATMAGWIISLSIPADYLAAFTT